MDKALRRLLRRLLNPRAEHELRRETDRIFQCYEKMRNDPGLTPEAMETEFVNSPDALRAIQLLAHALERNSDVATNPARRIPARLLGRKLGEGRYKTLYRLGAGGMGEVYAASRQRAFNREELVAVKTVKPELVSGTRLDSRQIALLLRRIRIEGQSLERVANHENVIRFIDDGFDAKSDQMFIVTELVNGCQLGELVSQDRFPSPLPHPEILWLIREACRGLIAIHRAPEPPTAGIGEGEGDSLSASCGMLLHRDVKPSNILFDGSPRVRLVDLGLAGPAGETSLIAGTMGYGAPEQFAGNQPLDERVDVYALGKTFLSLLNHGHLPQFSVPSNEADQFWNQFPVDYRRITERATSHDRVNRYANAEIMLEDLERLTPPAEPAECRNRLHQLLADQDREANIWVAQNLARSSFQISRRWFVGAGALGAISLLGWRFFGTGERSEVDKKTGGPKPIPPSDPLLAGSIDVMLWQPGDPGRQRLTLKHPLALPLRKGDQVRVHAKVTKSCFIYIIWIDAKGELLPIYPWKPGKWELQGEEKPTEAIDLPESTGGTVQGWPLASVSGMETLLLFASETPKARSVDFRQILTGLPRPTVQDDRALVWFNREGPVSKDDDPDRGPDFFNPQKIDDPLLQAQEQIRQKLGSIFPVIEAVSFANRAN